MPLPHRVAVGWSRLAFREATPKHASEPRDRPCLLSVPQRVGASVKAGVTGRVRMPSTSYDCRACTRVKNR